jgi:hypothetical protein
LQLVVDRSERPSLVPLMIQSRNLGELQGTRAGHYHGLHRGRLQGFLFGIVVGAVMVGVALRFGAFLGGH